MPARPQRHAGRGVRRWRQRAGDGGETGISAAVGGACGAGAARRGERLVNGVRRIAPVRCVPVSLGCHHSTTRRNRSHARGRQSLRCPCDGIGHVDRHPLPPGCRGVRRRPRRRAGSGADGRGGHAGPAGRGGRELRRRARPGPRPRAGLRAGHPPAVRRARRRRRPGPAGAGAASASRRPAPGGGRRDRAGPLRAWPGPRAPGALLRTPAEAGARCRAAGDPACAPLGRRLAQGPAPHRRGAGGIAHAFNGSAVQAQAFVGARLQARLRRRDDLRARARRSAPSRATCRTTCRCWRPTRPTSRRSGCTARAAERAAGHTQRNAPAELPRIAQVLADLRGWTLEATAAQTRANACAALPRLAALLSP